MRHPPVSRREFIATGSTLVAAACLPGWAEALQSAPDDAARVEAAEAALAQAARLGAAYADIRVSRYRRESIATRERQVRTCSAPPATGWAFACW